MNVGAAMAGMDVAHCWGPRTPWAVAAVSLAANWGRRWAGTSAVGMEPVIGCQPVAIAVATGVGDAVYCLYLWCHEDC